jgi:TolA-binding protein
MGKKPAGQRQYLFLYLTGFVIILIGFSGCTEGTYHTKKKIQSLLETEGEMDLAFARKLMGQGYFEASLKKSREVLMKYPHSLGDQALFQIGLNYAHSGNPGASAQKSREFFQRLITEFPKSTLKGEAEIWVLILKEKRKKEEEIRNFKKTYSRDTGRLNRKIDVLEKKDRENKSKIKKMQQRIDGLQVETKKLESQIDRLKNVDIKIQEQKSKTLQE